MSTEIKVAELFAGVGGFRLGLDGYDNPEHPEFHMESAGNFRTVWANQWEPGTDKRQFAARCYAKRFGDAELVNEDIHVVLDKLEAGEIEIPDVDMVVGGFPCQDYSVAKTLSQAEGIEGKKGVLWWDIYRFLRLKPSVKYCLLENVDRLLKSPAAQRGRDFAIILSCLNSLGFSVEWRVVNSAEYGAPQRRKRVYIYAEKTDETWDLSSRLRGGIMQGAFPVKPIEEATGVEPFAEPSENSESFGVGLKVSPFKTAGVMQNLEVLTANVVEDYEGESRVLGDVLLPTDQVPLEFFVPEDKLGDWEYLKGGKRIERVSKSGHTYMYSEGSMAFPDAADKPSRTILTGEGGVTPSRFKHIIQVEDGRYRRLMPDELDQLQCFPKGWTNSGMTDGQRAFCMGNALVTSIPHAIGKAMMDSGEFS